MANQFSTNGRWSLEEQETIISNYSHLSKQEMLSLLPNRTWMAIQHQASISKALKVKYKTRCELNRNFFSVKTPKSAYLLGVLEAEGSIGKNKITLVLGKWELVWITALRELAGSTAKMQQRLHGSFGDGLGWCVEFSSKQWLIDLKSLGLRSDKLPKLDDDLMRYYLRGYFDGDGSIFWDRYNGCYVSSFCGHPLSFIEDIRQTLITKGIIFQKARQDPGCSVTKGHRLPTVELANYLPQEEEYMLKRKTDLLNKAKVINPLKKKLRIELEGTKSFVTEGEE